MIFHAMKKRRSGHHGIVAKLFVDSAGVGRFPVADHVLVTNVAANAGHNAYTDLVVAREGRSLLDVKFNKASNSFQIDDGRAGRKLVRIETAGRDALAERDILRTMAQH